MRLHSLFERELLMTITKVVPLSKLFSVHSGDFHAVSELEIGDIPLARLKVCSYRLIRCYTEPARTWRKPPYPSCQVKFGCRC